MPAPDLKQVFKHVSRPLYSVPFSFVCELIKMHARGYGGTSSTKWFFLFTSGSVHWAYEKWMSMYNVASNDTVSAFDLRLRAIINKLVASTVDTDKYLERMRLKKIWINEQNDLGGSQALCIRQFVFRDRRKHSNAAARAILESIS